MAYFAIELAYFAVKCSLKLNKKTKYDFMYFDAMYNYFL